MGAGRKTQTFQVTRTLPTYSSNNSVANSVCCRNLGKYNLGGVIFGCKNSTMKECLYKKLFGLPAQHFNYVKYIGPGLPVFLFNYSDRTLHGVFEASSKGEMFIDPYAWVGDCSEITQYPAQVKIRVRLQCHPLSEDKFGKVIAENYYSNNHFLFELDHTQTNKLLSLLASLAIAPGTPLPKNNIKSRVLSPSLPSHKTMKQSEEFETQESEYFASSSRRTCSSKINSSLDGDIQRLNNRKVLKEVDEDEKNLIFMKLKELTLGHETQEHSREDIVNETLDEDNVCSVEKSYLEVLNNGLEKKEEECLSPQFEYQYTIDQLMQEVEELTALKKIYMEKNCFLEQKLMESALEIQRLQNRCKVLESTRNQQNLDPKESLSLIRRGFDGESWVSATNSYSPSSNVIKSLKSTSKVHSHASLVHLNDEFSVFGGGNGCAWNDKVESHNPIHNKWITCPSLNQKKGSMNGVSLNNKIFEIDGSNGVESFLDAEMLDIDIGRLMYTSPIIEKMYALASMELKTLPFAAAGEFNGIDYSKPSVKELLLTNFKYWCVAKK